jgi:signal peptide peptidase SppA
MLHTNSPGGAVAGASETAEAIANANKTKPVTAYIEDIGASGAYYLASQAGSISANPNAEVGSIGVYGVYHDMSKMAENLGVKVIIIRSGEHKGMGVPGAEITDNQIKAIQDVIDGMNDNFKNAVAAGRKISKEKVNELATGQVWIAKDALKLGLIDNIVNGINFSNTSENKINKSNMKGKDMPDPTQPTQTQIDEKEKLAADNAVTAERKRVADIKAAFTKDTAFALEQIEKGVSVLEAKAAYAEKLEAKNTVLETEKADLQKKVDAKSSGVEPVIGSGEGDAGGKADFLATARQLAKDEKISKTAAMQKLAKEQPELYESYITDQQNKATKKN